MAPSALIGAYAVQCHHFELFENISATCLHNGVNWNNGLQTLGGLAGLAGTRLVTPEGFKNIEDFVIGDTLVTGTSRISKGRWKPAR
jgi:hypothetical protein